jgi:hypothetical protein
LQARSGIGAEAEVVTFVVAGFDEFSAGIAAVGVVLVAGKAGPAACADGVEFRDEQATDAVVLGGAEDVFDLAVGFRVV